MPSLTIAAFTVLTLLAEAGQSPAPPRARSQTGSVSGRVIDAVSGKPIADAVIFPNPIPSRNEFGARTDADGRYTLEGLAPRVYLIRAEHPVYATAIYVSARHEGVREPIELRVGEHRTGVDFALARAGYISGQITLEDGRPVDGVNVVASGGNQIASILSTYTNEKGEYEARVPAGRYVIQATPTGPRAKQTVGVDRTYYPGVTRREDAVIVEVSVGDRLRGVDFRLVRSATRTVAGRVVGNTMLASEIRLSAASSPAGRLSRARAQPDGTFTIYDLKPGRHIVWARAELQDQIDVAFATLDVADDVTDFSLVLGPAGAISGRVVTDEKTPAPDAIRVVAALVDGANDVDPTVPDQGEIDADGNFKIAGLFGARRLRLVSVPEGWSLKTILINGREASPPDVVVSAGATIDKVLIVITRQ